MSWSNSQAHMQERVETQSIGKSGVPAEPLPSMDAMTTTEPRGSRPSFRLPFVGKAPQVLHFGSLQCLPRPHEIGHPPKAGRTLYQVSNWPHFPTEQNSKVYGLTPVRLCGRSNGYPVREDAGVVDERVSISPNVPQSPRIAFCDATSLISLDRHPPAATALLERLESCPSYCLHGP